MRLKAIIPRGPVYQLPSIPMLLSCKTTVQYLNQDIDIGTFNIQNILITTSIPCFVLLWTHIHFPWLWKPLTYSHWYNFNFLGNCKPNLLCIKTVFLFVPFYIKISNVQELQFLNILNYVSMDRTFNFSYSDRYIMLS